MDIRIAGTVNDSIVDGPGFRFTIFTQGCPHHCEGCHNPHTHDFNGGTVVDTEEILEKIFANPLLDGVTFSGGDPFCQAEPLVEIAKRVKEKGLDVITYTGYTWEYLQKNANEKNFWRELVEASDFIIDGKFEIEKRSLALHFRGSSNQRIIDVKKSLETGDAVTCQW